MRDALEGRRCRERELFRRDYVAALPAAPPDATRSTQLWQLAILEVWLEAHGL